MVDCKGLMMTRIALLLLLVAPICYGQTVYRCTGPSGETVFSQQACPDGGAGEEVKTHNPPPSNGSDYIPYGDTSVLPAPRERTAPRVNVVGGGHRCSNLSSQEIRTATVQKRALIGMTTAQMTKALGPPLRVNTSSHGSTQWVYPGRLYIYTEGGCVVSWN